MVSMIIRRSRSYKCLSRVIIDGGQVTENDTHTCHKKVIISKKIETSILTLEKYTKDFIESKSNMSLKVNRTCYIYTPMRLIKNYSQEMFKDIAFIIRSKSSVYFKIPKFEIYLIWIRFKPFGNLH
ncbi:LOW QUALITY PROTEIN: hypothetical protein HZS_4811 [Henneguya salminicola]|nr:LOW QUALITY PROTEIN: hypothetical protein HZS_4811 [Henneguya salminicola]